MGTTCPRRRKLVRRDPGAGSTATPATAGARGRSYRELWTNTLIFALRLHLEPDEPAENQRHEVVEIRGSVERLPVLVAETVPGFRSK
jgi:hypothetical protein